jgi:biopolymer transport protein ExbD
MHVEKRTWYQRLVSAVTTVPPASGDGRKAAVLRLSKQGEITLNEIVVELDDVPAALRESGFHPDGTTVVIRASRETEYYRVARLLWKLSGSRWKHVSLRVDE